ncbi:MAG: hypothetical protein ABID61_02975 [Candidatus Micrarchaeota archaeon]
MKLITNFLILLLVLTGIFLNGCLKQDGLEDNQTNIQTPAQNNTVVQNLSNNTDAQSLQGNVTNNATIQKNETMDNGNTEGNDTILTINIPTAIENNCVGFLIGDDHEMENIRLIGAAWARPHPGPFVWGFIERVQGSYDFSYTDEYVKEAQKNNISLLVTVWPFADWDLQDHPECRVSYNDVFYPRKGINDGLPIFRCKPNNMELYKKFLSVLVERYDGDGQDDMPGLIIPVKYWEISNEPEMKSDELTFFFGDEDDYLEILKESYQTIKQNCSDCKVVHAGAAGSDESSLLFWGNVYSKGGTNYFDIANTHFVSFGDEETLNIKNFQFLLNEHNIDKQLWLTEAEFKDSNVDIKSSVKGAFDAGADRIFFTGFKVGGHDPVGPGKYSQVYKEIVALCPNVSISTVEQISDIDVTKLNFTVIEEAGTRVVGGIPFAYKLDNGNTILYYCNGGIKSSISEDGVVFANETATGINDGCDPTIVKNSDGKIRMYYKWSSGPGGPGQAVHKIYSAISDDGITFQKEGIIIDSQNSSDNGWASVPEAIKLANGNVRIYYVSGDPQAEGGTMSAISSDGLHFEKENGVRMKGIFVDPAITILPDGRYWFLLVHHCVPGKGSCGGENGIYSFVSDDGLIFSGKQLLYHSDDLIDPTIAKIDDSTYRIYYWSITTPDEESYVKSILVNIQNI